jgi:hypothetical protein
MKMTIDELKRQIGELVNEAKKKDKKAVEAKKKPAYGFYEEALDFSEPLGAFNLYGSQGGVNWGPMTSAGAPVSVSSASPERSKPSGMNESEEQILRSLVREVITTGVPVEESSAWAVFLPDREPIFENAWGEAIYEAKKHWFQKTEKDDCKPAKGYEKQAKKGGESKDDKKSKKKDDKKDKKK